MFVYILKELFVFFWVEISESLLIWIRSNIKWKFRGLSVFVDYFVYFKKKNFWFREMIKWVCWKNYLFKDKEFVELIFEKMMVCLNLSLRVFVFCREYLDYVVVCIFER